MTFLLRKFEFCQIEQKCLGKSESSDFGNFFPCIQKPEKKKQPEVSKSAAKRSFISEYFSKSQITDYFL